MAACFFSFVSKNICKQKDADVQVKFHYFCPPCGPLVGPKIRWGWKVRDYCHPPSPASDSIGG